MSVKFLTERRAVCTIVLGWAITCGAWAQSEPEERTNPDAHLLDRPLSVVDLAKRDGAHPSGRVRCSYYDNAMIRETKGGAGDQVSVLRRQTEEKLPTCNATESPGETKVGAGGQALIGKAGGFLFLESTTGRTSQPFEVVRLKDGKTVYTDTRLAGGFKTITAEGDTLKFTYARAVNGTCSIPEDSVLCWVKIVKANRLAGAIAAQPTPVQACASAYASLGSRPGKFSIITYDVSMIVPVQGKAVVLSRGEIGCEPAT